MFCDSPVEAAVSDIWKHLSMSRLISERNLVLSFLFVRLVSEHTYSEKSALWECLLRNAPDGYYQALLRALERICRDFPKQLGDLPMPCAPARAQASEQLTELFNDIPPVLLGTAPAEVFAAFLRCFAAQESNDYGDFYLPGDVVRYLCKLLQPMQGEFYAPCCGSGALLEGILHTKNAPQVLHTQIRLERDVPVCRMNLFLNRHVMDFGRTHGSALHTDAHAGHFFDRILASPPFNEPTWRERPLRGDARWAYGPPPKSNANFAWISHILYHLKEGGRAAVLLSTASLSSHVQRECTIRSTIVQSGLVEAVIMLPAGLFYSTRVSCCVWVFHKRREVCGKVLLIDARECGVKAGARGQKSKALTDAEVTQLCALVQHFRTGTLSDETAGISAHYATPTLQEIAQQGGFLSPERYIEKTPCSETQEAPKCSTQALWQALAVLQQREQSIDREIAQCLEAMNLVM